MRSKRSTLMVDGRPDVIRKTCEDSLSRLRTDVIDILLSVKAQMYLIEAAEKGMAWMRLTAAGTAGHGSMVNQDNAVTALCEAVAKLGRHEFPIHVTSGGESRPTAPAAGP